jgi:hypothetical protein
MKQNNSGTFPVQNKNAGIFKLNLFQEFFLQN